MFVYQLNMILVPNWNAPVQVENICLSIDEFNSIHENLDVLFLGSSHVCYSVYPDYLYSRFGITSYNMATNGQPLAASKYFLRKSFENGMNPQIAILDVSNFFYYSDEPQYHFVLDNIKFDLDKIELVNDLYLEQQLSGHIENKMYYYLKYFVPLYSYHSRWDELKMVDFESNKKKDYFMQGACMLPFVQKSYTDEEYNDINASMIYDNDKAIVDTNGNTDNIVDSTMYNFDILDGKKALLFEMKQICDDNNCQLLLVKIPVNKSPSDYSSSWTKYRHDVVCKMAKEMEIPFWDMNYDLDSGIDWEKDSIDSGVHLNYRGGKKVTECIGKELIEQYGLNSQERECYEYNTTKIHRYEAVIELELCDVFLDYLDLLKKMDNLCILVSCKDDMTENLYENEIEGLNSLGFATDFRDINYAYSFIGIVNNRIIVHEMYANRPQDYSTSIGNNDIYIYSGGYLNGRNSSIVVDNVEYSMNMRGINLVIIDIESGLVIDRCNIDTCGENHTVVHSVADLQYKYQDYLMLKNLKDFSE